MSTALIAIHEKAKFRWLEETASFLVNLPELRVVVASIKDAYMVTSLNISRLQSHHVSDTIASHGNQSTVLLDGAHHNEYI